MEFLHGQETLTALQWVLRAATGFLFLIIIAKVLGQRAISQLRLLDFVIALVIGDIIAHPLSDPGLGMKGAMITTIVLVILYLLGIFGILNSPRFRTLVNNAPITIVENGEIIYSGMKKARISLDVLLEEMRERQIDSIKKVALSLWEADGKISFFIDPKHQPLTPSQTQIETEPFDLPRTIIKEGYLNSEEIKQSRRDKDWIIARLAEMYGVNVEDVLLGTLDKKDNLTIFLYKNN
ncbi:hypothetical protein A8F94_16025 [Bacillus sp. FJAT-27225]|uniref:DUF421 domain-containing protein n=1 Tax=Bacillus sp. FJAT-27225 TaxID=1743144 RepID=UPI00080C2D83|nr:YetF domain-containing protein [Bacillus sp. FJAT-27225]OCA84223.1 hypothetical protein A8F94_16025 [Bacillus sp. FJAT-27225]